MGEGGQRLLKDVSNCSHYSFHTFEPSQFKAVCNTPICHSPAEDSTDYYNFFTMHLFVIFCFCNLGISQMHEDSNDISYLTEFLEPTQSENGETLYIVTQDIILDGIGG